MMEEAQVFDTTDLEKRLQIMRSLALIQSSLHRKLAPKYGLNDYCVCGSGKKFKKCCWKTVREQHNVTNC